MKRAYSDRAIAGSVVPWISARPSANTVTWCSPRRNRSNNALTVRAEISPCVCSLWYKSVSEVGRWCSWICTAFRPHKVMCGRPEPERCVKTRPPQTRQSGSGAALETSDCWLVHTSYERNVRRSRLGWLVSSFKASAVCNDAARLTAAPRIPAVSQVSTRPEGGAGNRQARHAVAPGTMFIVAAEAPTAPA